MIVIDKNYSKYISKEISTTDVKKILISLKEDPIEILPSPESSVYELVIEDDLDENGYLLLQYSTGNFLVKVSDIVQITESIYFENTDPFGDNSLIDAISLTTKNLEYDSSRIFSDHILTLNGGYIGSDTQSDRLSVDEYGRYYLSYVDGKDLLYKDYITENILPKIDNIIETIIIGKPVYSGVNNIYKITFPLTENIEVIEKTKLINSNLTNSFSEIYNNEGYYREIKFNNIIVEKDIGKTIGTPYQYYTKFNNIVYIGFFSRELTEEERNQLRFGVTTKNKQLRFINIKNEIPKIYYLNTTIDLIEKDENGITITNKNTTLNPFTKTNDKIVLLTDNGISSYLEYIYVNTTNKVNVTNITNQQVTIDTINSTGYLNDYIKLIHRYTLDETLSDELGGDDLELTDDANEQYDDGIFGKGFKLDGSTGIIIPEIGNVISFWLKIDNDDNSTYLFNKSILLGGSYLKYVDDSGSIIRPYLRLENNIFHNIIIFEVDGECLIYLNGTRVSSTFNNFSETSLGKSINGVLDHIEIFNSTIPNAETADIIARHIYNRQPFYQTIIEYERQLKIPEIFEIKDIENNKNIKADIENDFTNTNILFDLNLNTKYINYELSSTFGNKKIYNLNIKLFK